MVELIHDIDPERVAENLERVRERAGAGVEILAATKYVPIEEMGGLAEAGVKLVGENRLQDMEAKQDRWGDTFTWDFIGAVQSRKARTLVERSRLVHSVASDSALRKLEAVASAEAEILVEVNLSGEESKAGIDPAELGDFIDRSPVRVTGLMTMPPFTEDSEASRPYFVRLAALASEHGLSRLSMGTSQDWQVAVDEGATIIRLGSSLYR